LFDLRLIARESLALPNLISVEIVQRSKGTKLQASGRHYW
jgi:hypothetical protein